MLKSLNSFRLADEQGKTILASKKLILTVRFTGLLICLLIITRLVDWNTLLPVFSLIPVWVLFFSLILGFLRFVLSALRWQVLNPDPGGELRTRDYLRYLLIGAFFSLILPGQLGGDLIRSVYIARECSEHKVSHLLTIGVDRIIGLFSIIVLGTVACILSPQLANQKEYLLTFSVMLLFFVGCCFVSVNQYFNERLSRILARIPWAGSRLVHVLKHWSQLFGFYKSARIRLVGAFCLSLGVHLMTFIIVYLFATALQIDLGFWPVCIITSLSVLITSVPISFGGLGVRELSFVYLLGLYGVSADSAIALSLCQFGILVVFSLAGAPFVWYGRRSGGTRRAENS